MNKALLAVTTLLLATTTQAQVLFEENFDACGIPTDWTNTAIEGNDDWQFSDNLGDNIDGSCMVFFDDDAVGQNAAFSLVELESPTIDLSGVSAAELNFDYVFEDLGLSQLSVLAWNGADWDTVFTEVTDPGCFGWSPGCAPRVANINISDYLTANFKFKLVYDDGDAWSWHVGVDNIEIVAPASAEAELTSIDQPVNDCGLGMVDISLSITNLGADTITSIDAAYEIDGGGAVMETFTVSIPFGNTGQVTFATQFDASTVATYNIEAWINLLNDTVPTNDSLNTTFSNIPVITGLPYFEDFENGDGGWAAGGDLSSWELGLPTATFIDTANSGVNAWVTNLTGQYNNGEISYVESPCLDFSSLVVDPILQFAHIFSTEACCDEGYVDISFDAGTTWSRLGLFDEGENWYNDQFNIWWDGASGDSTVWRTATHLIDGAAGESSVKLRFGFSSDGSITADGFGVDDIEIFEQPPVNAGIAEFISPISGCGLSTEPVTVVVQNFGSDTLFNFEVGFDLMGGAMVTENFDTLLPGALDTFTFATGVDLSVFGGYDMMAWTMVVGDADTTNDSLSISFNSFDLIAGLPYYEDFENGPGGWTTGGTASTWELGEPTATFIDTANSGINAWVTNLDSLYNANEFSYIESPCMDFSTLSIDPVLRFAQIFSTENNFDEGYVDVSFDAGTTWNRLGLFGEGTNWYNDAGNNWWEGTSGNATEWRTATQLIDGAAGEPSVKLRIVFSSDGSGQEEGFGVDDIQVFEQPAVNAGVIEVIAPISGCGLSSETVMVVVENFGSTDIVDFDMVYDAGGGSVSEVHTDTLFAASTDTFTFTTMVDLSVPGLYDINAWTEVLNDGDTTNDSTMVSVNNFPIINTLPYIEDFENGAAGWATGGVASTWELGDPQNVFIDTANSGVNAWVTNLTGDYVNNELSYIESPCLDFSTVTIDPVLEFAHIFNAEACCDENYVDISFDAGANWSRLGLFGEGENWYNDQFNNWWDGTSGNPTEWRTAMHLIDGAAGEANVKLRIGFSSDGSVTGEGFGVDDINIYEQPPINGEMVSIDSPQSNCGLSDTMNVAITVSNLGSEIMDSVIVSYMINGGAMVTEVFDSILNPMESVSLTFNQQADMSVPGDYMLTTIITTTGDGDMTNDTLSTLIQNIPVISIIPYFEDFENGTGGWSSTDGTNGNWELGDPEGIFIDTAFSGVNAWATNLNSLNYANGQLSMLTSPCMDLSSMTADPILHFATIFDSEFNYDAFFVEASVDGGANWSLVGNVGDGINWYTNDNFFNGNIDEGFAGQSNTPVDWIESEIIVQGIVGMSSVRIRFVFSSDGSVNGFEGAAIDDISLFPQPQLDLVALRMDAPENGCDLSDETVTMTYWNKGLLTQNSYDLGYIVDGTTVTETATITVDQGDSATYTFTTLADLSAAGDHDITVFTALAGDEDMDSDTVSGYVVTSFTNTPMVQSNSESLPLNGGEGPAISSLFVCGIDELLDGCFTIDYVSIDNFTHAWVSDLDINLVSPSGDTVLLSSGNGCCAGGTFSGIIFADGNNSDITLQQNGLAPGTYNTQDPLGFDQLNNGLSPNGEWQLIMEDPFTGDLGTFDGWTLAFVDNSPTPSLSYGDSTICVNHTIELSATAGMDSYLWNTLDNGQTLTLNGETLGVGDHEYSVTVELDGCSGVSETITITVDECTGIEEANGIIVNMYPNPTSGQFTLELEGVNDNVQLSVVETTGRVVYATDLPNGTNRHIITLTDVATGVYTVKLTYNGTVVNQILTVK